MRPQLYCDIDSTINDHWKRIQRNTVNGYIQPSAWTEAEVMQDTPLNGAVMALNRFASDFDIHFLSSRNWLDAKRITEAWLRREKFPFTSVNLVGRPEDKITFLKEHWCDLYIDDFTGGQEYGGPPAPVFYGNVVRDMPCPYEVFHPENPNEWNRVLAKYYEAIPNGELFWQLQRRNLEWWRANRDYESKSRARYYNNFCQAVGLTKATLRGKVVAEVGAGPFGGLIRHLNGDTRYEVYIDILANAQRVLRFIDWPTKSQCLDSPVECIALQDKSIDLLLSYNAIDHGSNVFKALDEIVRVSKEAFIAFDCKANTAPPHDRVDHYQIVEFKKVCDHVTELIRQKKIAVATMGDLRHESPGFHFEHNWDFPIFFAHLAMR